MSSDGGVPVDFSSSSSLSNLNRVSLGFNRLSNSLYINGHLKKFSYYSSPLTEDNLRALTGNKRSIFRFPSLGEPIVTSGLVLYLDAGNPASYPGSGTTWTDLSGNGNNGTLVNGVGYNSGNGGSLVFDGVDDYVSCPLISSSITNITMMGFVNVILNKKGAFFRNGGGGNGYSIGIGSGSFDTFDSNGNNVAVLFPGVRWIATTTQYSAGWQMVTFILNASSVVSGYLNTTPITFPTGRNPITPTSNFYIGRNLGDEPFGARAANCSVSNCFFYNRALTAAEIQQNFNALRGRFGI
jgi:hypothetical protein